MKLPSLCDEMIRLSPSVFACCKQSAARSRAYWFGCQAVGGSTGWVGSKPQLVGVIQTTSVDDTTAMKKVHM